MIIKVLFSFFLHKIVSCGYSLESPHQGDSQYQQCMFYGELTKIILYHKIPTFTILLLMWVNEMAKNKKKNSNLGEDSVENFAASFYYVAAFHEIFDRRNSVVI